jgi:hypothetical protein
VPVGSSFRDKDLVIGCFTNYEWPDVQYWANSLDRSGFAGDRVVAVHNVRRETIARFEALGFLVYPIEPTELASGFSYAFPHEDNYAHRFQAYFEYLSQLPSLDEYRFAIATDVRDVVFQRDPSAWLEDHLGDKMICASSESLLYKDEPWGDESMRNAYPRLYAGMAARPIWNCGVQAGDARVMKDFWLQLAMTTAAGLGAADQAAYNILLSLRPWSEMTLFAMSEDGWACQAGTTAWSGRAAAFQQSGLEPAPVWHEEFSRTQSGDQHAILHQYDRVPEWRAAVHGRFAAVD